MGRSLETTLRKIKHDNPRVSTAAALELARDSYRVNPQRAKKRQSKGLIPGNPRSKRQGKKAPAKKRGRRRKVENVDIIAAFLQHGGHIVYSLRRNADFLLVDAIFQKIRVNQ